jgi:hypothetical protein
VSYRQKSIEGTFSDAIPKNGPINWGSQGAQIGKLILETQAPDAKQRIEQVMQLNLSNNVIAPLNLRKAEHT